MCRPMYEWNRIICVGVAYSVCLKDTKHMKHLNQWCDDLSRNAATFSNVKCKPGFILGEYCIIFPHTLVDLIFFSFLVLLFILFDHVSRAGSHGGKPTVSCCTAANDFHLLFD